MKVKFVSDALARTEVGTEKLFSAGDIQDLNDASAERWIRRGIAVATSESSAPNPVAKKASKKTRKK